MVCTSDFDSESKCSIHFRLTLLTLLIFTVRENSKTFWARMYQGWRGSLARNLWRVRFSSGPHMKKRYQYWSKDGLKWTDWFDWDVDFMPEFQMNDRRIFCRLKNEYKED